MQQRYQYVQPSSPMFQTNQRPSLSNRSLINNNNNSQQTLNLYGNNNSNNRLSIISGERYPGAQSSIDDETLTGSSSSKSKLLSGNNLDKSNRDSSSSFPYSNVQYGSGSFMEDEEDDDFDDFGQHKKDKNGMNFKLISCRGCLNLTTLLLISLGLLMLFAGYPILEHFYKEAESKKGAFNIGGTNGTGQVPILHKRLGLIDQDTPMNARRWISPMTNEPFHLVFSDEFEEEGRTFWPGDDPFWEGVNIWYGATADYEWYSPEQLNTSRGALQITMEAKPLNNLNFRSGMLQSWNKFCFQGGYIEFSAVLPGAPTEVGWWPGLWLQGNLARPGYLGTTDGMWPYSYNSCDSGILPNQTASGRRGYSTVAGYRQSDGKIGLNWNNGMRTPSCTCSGEDHPGPNVNVGRSAPELDILEAQIRSKSIGQSSQSLQAAPFDPGHKWGQSNATIHDENTVFNTFDGNTYQMTISGVSTIPDSAYARTNDQYTSFALEYTPDFEGRGRGSITWYMDGKPMWTLPESAIGPRSEIDIGQRFVPLEAMSIVMNFGISRGFQADLDFDTLNFPATMKIDYVRVYQLDSQKEDKVSCNPKEYPTTDYIERHKDVYTNANHTTWPKTWPKNRLVDGC